MRCVYSSERRTRCLPDTRYVWNTRAKGTKKRTGYRKGSGYVLRAVPGVFLTPGMFEACVRRRRKHTGYREGSGYVLRNVPLKRAGKRSKKNVPATGKVAGTCCALYQVSSQHQVRLKRVGRDGEKTYRLSDI